MQSKLMLNLFLFTAVQWGIFAPLNLVKVLINKPSPMAKHFVSEASESCQQSCDIARLWATLFWSGQIAFALGFFSMYQSKKESKEFLRVAAIQKIMVGILLMKGFRDGVIHLPITSAGALEFVLGFVFLFHTFTEKGLAFDNNWKKLLQFTSEWWYPWVVGVLSAVNNFTLVLSGPLSILFISGVLAKPERKYICAIANALGAALGMAALVYVCGGEEGIRSRFSIIFDEQGKYQWALLKSKELVEAGGIPGAVVISVLPIVLHPLVVFGLFLGMSAPVLIMCILAGRIVKYIIMGQLALEAPHLLSFFGKAAASAATGNAAGKATKITKIE
eukprot:m.27032 g.27032  ORF g.27032 m.27032 type:complete len:333 (-) comp7856_c1_seq1:968-1966(-)